jgi:hypothetical protein
MSWAAAKDGWAHRSRREKLCLFEHSTDFLKGTQCGDDYHERMRMVFRAFRFSGGDSRVELARQ